jgi:Domain of unknown function (DUF4253)
VNGSLPPDDAADIAGVRLPPGRRVGDERRAGRPAEPALWVTTAFEQAASTWLALRERLRGTGLVPLLLSDLPGKPGRPWQSGELRPARQDAVAGLDVSAVLRDLWDRSVPGPEQDEADTVELLVPYSRSFPGLAPATTEQAGADELEAAVLAANGPLRIGVALAARPADALVSIGWTGAANHDVTAGLLAAVLRSWEERFGATLMHLGFATMDLLVERPALSSAAAFAVAAEHFAFCADNVRQGAGSIREYAEDLLGATRWSFRWDECRGRAGTEEH